MQHVAINRERLLDTFGELLAINTPSRRETAMAMHIIQHLEELGATTRIDQAGAKLGGDIGNVIAHFPGTLAAPPLLLCSHMDTVEPTEALQVIREDGVIHSDGTTILGADDKAGIAAILEVLHTLKESGMPHPPIELAFTVCEEVGLMGSQVLAYDGLTAKYGFVPDSSGQVGLIITRAPAQQHLHVTITGRAAHAGMAPEEGINAIAVAARALAEMRQGRIDEETTANIGTIRGGKATNIVSDQVELEGEARSRDPHKLAAQVAHMCACFRKAATAAGATAEITVTDVYPAFNLPSDSLPVQLASAALTELGITPTIAATGGGSDANFINNYGIQTVILSTGYHHPHSVNERQEEAQLALLAQSMLTIVRLAGERAS